MIRVTAPPPSRTPARTVAQPDTARAALRYALVVIAGLVLLLVLVAGCGAAPLPPAAPSTIAPTTPAPPPPTTTAAPTTTPTGSPDATPGQDEGGRAPAAAPAPRPHAAPKQGGAGGPAPIWPAANQASAVQLQNQVDGGRQPWLLDPTEVAVSYAGAVLGYRNPGVFPTGAGRIDVQDGRSPAKATITLGQTVRRGDGGIWLVTGVQKR